MLLVALFGVALRKESVDRNNDTSYKKKSTRQSLSARRAWIEIGNNLSMSYNAAKVALRKESVDRNCRDGTTAAVSGRVALRKESVDRNK